MTGTVIEQPREKVLGTGPTREVPIFTPRFDIVESETELTLHGDLPGVSANQIDIRYENDQLIIHGKVADRSEGTTFLHQEYGVGDFHRSFTVGESIDSENVRAEVHNGVLTVHLPKAVAAKPRSIEVTAV